MVLPYRAGTSSGNIAFGYQALIGGPTYVDSVVNALAIGTGAVSQRSNGIAIGAAANVAFAGISIGTQASSGGDGAVAIGGGSLAAGGTSLAIGQNARVVPSVDTGSIALGNGATIAPYGADASSPTSGAVAIGMNAAIGSGVNAIAIGTGSSSQRSNGIAIGASSLNAFEGIAIGTKALTGIDGQIAIGTGAYADPAAGTPGGVAIGQGSYTGGNGAALGLNASAAGASVAVGPNAYAGYRNVVVGALTTATGNESVAIGFGSTDAGRDQVVSVGSSGLTRAVTNVTAGTMTTDAANVGQLPATINSNVVTMGNTLAPGGNSSPVKVTNVADGALSGSSTDVVNGSQLFATNLTVTSNKQMLDNLSARVVNGTIGLVQQQAGAPGSGLITVGAQTGGTSVDFTGTSGTRRLSGVGAGTAASDAVNLSQLNAVAGSAANAVQYDGADHASVTLGGTGASATVALKNVAPGTLTGSSSDAVNGAQLFSTNQAVANASASITNLSNGIDAGAVGLVRQNNGAPGTGAITVGAQTGGTSVDITGTNGARTLSGVAAGAAATDAVNVGQLGAVAAVAANAVQYDGPGQTHVTLGSSGAPVGVSNLAAGQISGASTDAVNGAQLFATNQAVADNAAGLGVLSTGIATGSVGLVRQVDGSPGTGPITIGAQTGGTSVDITGTSGARTLSGVAAGASATDAANVGQLNAVAGVAANAVRYDDAGHAHVTLGGSSAPVGISNVAAGSLTASSDDAVNGAQLYVANQAIAGNSAAIQTNAAALGTLSTGIATGTVGLVRQVDGAPGTGPITIGAQTGGSSVDITGTNGARTLSGVAAGAAATDAVNVGQLNAVAGVAANAVQYDDSIHTHVTLGSGGAPVGISNVAAGGLTASSTDAVNGAQLYSTNQTVVANGAAIQTNASALQSLSTKIVAGTVGLVQQAGGAPGNGPITVGGATGGSAVDITGTNGARTLSGVAAGAAATDAVNVGQLNAVAGVAANAVQYDDSSRAHITLGGGGAPVGISNVAAGSLTAASADAVNGAQLYAANQAIAGNSAAIQTNVAALGALSTGIATGTVGLLRQVDGAPGTGAITIGAQTGGTSVDITGTNGARTLSGVAAGAAATDAVNVGQLNAVAGVAANAVQYDDSSRAHVTLGGGGAPVGISNVAAGSLTASSADAVNGAQLYAANQAIAGNSAAIQTNVAALGALSTGIATGTVGLVRQVDGAPGTGAITIGAQTGGTSVDITGTNGARTLSGVAAGAAATDAVNVGQLNAVAGVAANAVQYDDSSRAHVTLGGGGAPVGISNVAAGSLTASSADAVNGAQLYAANQAIAGNSAAIQTNVAALGALSTGIATGTVGLVRQVDGAPGTGAITIGAATGGSAVDFAGTSGPRALKGVAAGTDATDAVNVGQLNAVAGVASNAVQYDDATHGRVTLGNGGAPVGISNVAAGNLSASSTDAVNGAQLYATNQALAGTSASLGALSTGIASGTIGMVQQTGGAPGNGTITVGASTGGTAVDFSGTSGARKLQGVAAGTDDTDAVNVSQLKAVVGGATANAVTYDDVLHTSVTLGGIGAGAPVQLRNVAVGSLSLTSTDAVNGSQLYATNLAVAANTTAIAAISTSLTDVQSTVAKNMSQKQSEPTVDGSKYFTATSAGAAATATGLESVAAGGNARATGGNSAAIGSGAFASGSGSVALGTNAMATGTNAVAIGQGSVATTDNSVSFGNSASGLTRTLANVSAGVAPTDAVNVQQLNDSVASVRSQIEHDRADANGGTATAIAIASLPQAPAPGKSVVSIGGGTYAGQSAMAVGVSTYSGRWILKASGSTNTRGTVGAGVGAGYVW
ncbi:YadA-like family protein [Burkholderia cepacia]|uniref:YadA-like family protein n=1 Tax=Burkholderia cepacia TaxID=292 RepID=UPI002AB7AA76|nr:YadA-like family protein [Burkholderia cepacia]